MMQAWMHKTTWNERLRGRIAASGSTCDLSRLPCPARLLLDCARHSFARCRKRERRLIPVAVAALLAFSAPFSASGQGLVDQPVASVGAPTATAFTPDGRLLIITQSGTVRVMQAGSLLATPALTFNTSATGAEPKLCFGGEMGLLGIAVDPDFVASKHIYLFYTARNGAAACGGHNYTAANPVDGTPAGTYSGAGRTANRVSRFTLGVTGDPNVIDPASEVVLVDRMPARGTNHNAGDIQFGKDGHLYIAIGDGGTDYAGASPGSAGGNDAARDRNVLTGKILRIAKDGSIPPDNPFAATGADCRLTGGHAGSGHCRETWAWGLRNPFRFATDENATGVRLYINDVGQGLWEEVNEGVPGADYGWNACEGRHDNGSTAPGCAAAPPGSVLPVFEYPHGGSPVPGTSLTGCNSITAGAFVPRGLWTPAFDGRYLIADFVCGAIFSIDSDPATVTPATPAVTAQTVLSSAGSVTSMTWGPFGYGRGLYYTRYNAGGQVRVLYFDSALLDIDGNGVVEAATDGVLLLRALFGLRGAALVAGALGSGATRDADAIAGYVTARSAGADPAFDVNGDGRVDATTDGLLAFRHLLGLSGSALVTGVPLGSSRPTAAEVRRYLQTRSP